MDPTATPRARLFFFGALYFAQGVPWGFIAVTLAIYLSGQGMGEEAIGKVLSLSYLPWAFKPLMGPVADGLWLGRLGRRRPWIVAAELGMGLSLLALAAVDPRGAMGLFLGLIFAHNVFAAAQDVGVDALAVELLGEDERGTGNSVMWASKYAGVAVGGAGFSAIAAALGWRWLFVLMAALILAISALPALVREPRPETPRAPRAPRPRTARDALIHGISGVVLAGGIYPVYRWGGWVSSLWFVVLVAVGAAVARTFVTGATPIKNRVITGTIRSFALRSTFFGLVLVLLSLVGTGLLGPVMVPLYKNRLGYSDAEIGTLSGLISSVVGVAGALAGGILSDKIGRRRAIVLFTVASGATYAAFGALTALWHMRGVTYTFVITSALADGMLQATFLSLCMDLSNPAVSGSQFTAFMGIANVRHSWASLAGGLLASRLAAPAMFVVAAVCQVASLGLLPLVNPEEAKRAFRDKGEPREQEEQEEQEAA